MDPVTEHLIAELEKRGYTAIRKDRVKTLEGSYMLHGEIFHHDPEGYRKVVERKLEDMLGRFLTHQGAVTQAEVDDPAVCGRRITRRLTVVMPD